MNVAGVEPECGELCSGLTITAGVEKYALNSVFMFGWCYSGCFGDVNTAFSTIKVELGGLELIDRMIVDVVFVLISMSAASTLSNSKSVSLSFVLIEEQVPNNFANFFFSRACLLFAFLSSIIFDSLITEIVKRKKSKLKYRSCKWISIVNTTTIVAKTYIFRWYISPCDFYEMCALVSAGYKEVHQC